MKLKDLLTVSTYNAIGDMDVSNDCIDECAPAWCGNTLTEEGERQFAAALNLDSDDEFYGSCTMVSDAEFYGYEEA